VGMRPLSEGVVVIERGEGTRSRMEEGATRVWFKGIGASLLLLTLVPFYGLLPHRESGLAGEVTAELSEITAGVLYSGALLALIPAVILARLVSPRAIERHLSRIGAWLARPPTAVYALALAVLAGSLVLGFSLAIQEGKPNLIDAMAQLLHARYLAAGKLAGPVDGTGPFWHVQNSIVTPNGWVSQYPPVHVFLLAAGFRLGAVWAVGPSLAALTVLFVTLSAERLLPDDLPLARFGAFLAAVNPFFVGLAGVYMNHVTAAAFGAMALYFAIRARDGRAAWAMPTGAALALAFGTRPLSGLVFGVLAPFVVWLRAGVRGQVEWRHWARWAALASLGALPLILALCAYNRHFFGSPFRFGYSVAHGETTRLGFHTDPWGNDYGPLEALAYTSADLVALSLNLFESVLPVVALVGVYFLVAKRLSFGERVIAAWALLPVLANAFYWHHGLFMGPRMLNEVAPAWALLTAVAAAGVVRRIPVDRKVIGEKYSPRTAALAFLLVAGGVGMMVLAPQRMLSYRNFMPSARMEPPTVEGPALIFVHGGWTERLGMLLAASGMRLDSVETALRQNSTCRVHEFAQAYAAPSGRPRGTIEPVLDFERRAQGFPEIVEISSKNRIRVVQGEVLTEPCRREIDADRNGIVNVVPLLWQGDLPGLPGKGALFIRDMGPEMNALLIRRYPDRRPMVLRTSDPESPPVLEPYDVGMAAIWGGER